MRINFVLNHHPVEVDVFPQKSLPDLLKDDFGLKGTRAGCRPGRCGSCVVLLDEQPIYGCLAQAFMVRDRKIITIEGFEESPAFSVIAAGFSEYKTQPCAYCRGEKYLIINWLIQTTIELSEQKIAEYFGIDGCRCLGIDLVTKVARSAKRLSEAENRD